MDTPLVIDGHTDVLLRLQAPRPGGERSFFERSERGHVDLPRMQEGGVAAAFFAVFVPEENAGEERRRERLGKPDREDRRSAIDPSYARSFTREALNLAARLEAESGGAVRRVLATRDLDPCLAGACLGMILHLEGAEAVDRDLGNLGDMYGRGVRSVGIVWSRPNDFGLGVPFRCPGHPDTGDGLTAAGRSLVEACNEMGILVDVAHLNEKGFWDVAARSRAPIVSTHGGVHALCASARNLTDRQLDAIGASGGLVGITLGVQDLRADGRSDARTEVGEVIRHIEYVAGRLGIEHVALGTDFDGATVPEGIGDVSGLPRLLRALRVSGWSDGDLENLAWRNWVRVAVAAWRRG